MQLLINGNPVAIDGNGMATVMLDAPGVIEAIAIATDAAGNEGVANISVPVTDALKKVTEFRYDPFGNVEAVIDPRLNETTFTYDRNGNRETETKKVTTPQGIQELVTVWKYDGSGKLQSITDPENNVTEYKYDANGNQTAVLDAKLYKTEYRYDEKGQLVETIYPDKTPDNQSDNLRTINVYDRGGRLRATIDEAFRVTHYKYNEVGQLIETIYPDKTDSRADFLAAVVPNQNWESIDWTKVIYPDETPAYLSDNPRTKTEYYQTGEVKAEIDEQGNRTEYKYNANGQLIEIIYPDKTPGNALDNPRTTYKYDWAGNQTSVTDALGHTTTFVYDKLGRVKETHFHDKTYTTTTYDPLGREIAFTDSAGKTTKYEYDPNGRLTDVVQTLKPAFAEPIEIRTEYGYDEAGRLIWAEDANDYRTKYEYDKAGNRTATELPLGQRAQTTYNKVGLVESVTDFNGDTITYKYDEQNRLTAKEFTSSSTQKPVTFTYTPTGQIEKIIDERGPTTFKYDERSRLISRTDPTGPYLASGATIEYEYNDAGNRTLVRTPAGTVRYTYDELHRLETVTDPDLGVTSYKYDSVGNLKQTVFPNKVIETRDYDDLNRLKLLKYSRLDNSGNEVAIASYDYTLDPVGHRRVVKEQNGRQVEYKYDDLYRLTKETITDSVKGHRTIEYTYDAIGNRLTRSDSIEGVTTYKYDKNDRLYSEELRKNGVLVSTVEYRYDNNGNTLRRIENGTEETVYTWDKENRLVGVTTPDGDSIKYTYDTDGIRVSKTVNGVTTDYLVDKNLPYAQVLAEYADDELAASYVYGLDLISQEQGNDESFYLVDGLGSTRALTDETGNVINTYTYDAFGNLIDFSGNLKNDYLFAGEQYDENLEQYYLRQRYYDPNVGRFTRRDTYEGSLANPVTLHKYLYANANPVGFVDPSGLSSNLIELETAFQLQGTLAALFWVSLAAPILVLTKEAINDFLNFYAPYFPTSTDGDKVAEKLKNKRGATQK